MDGKKYFCKTTSYWLCQRCQRHPAGKNQGITTTQWGWNQSRCENRLYLLSDLRVPPLPGLNPFLRTCYVSFRFTLRVLCTKLGKVSVWQIKLDCNTGFLKKCVPSSGVRKRVGKGCDTRWQCCAVYCIFKNVGSFCFGHSSFPLFLVFFERHTQVGTLGIIQNSLQIEHTD